MDLENFETVDGDPTNAHAGSNHDISLTNHDMSLTNDDMNDVMKVLTDLDGYDVDADGGDKNLDSLTSVQDVSRVVDKSALANEKYTEAMTRQQQLERKFADLAKKINQLRCQKFCGHVSEELVAFRSYCERVAPSPPATSQPNQASITMPSTTPFNFQVLRPPNMPDGAFLPNTPSPQVTPSLPTAPLSLQDITPRENDPQRTSQVSKDRAPPPTLEEKRRTDEVFGQLDAGLRQLIPSYDSDATESSSGGESCDELDEFSTKDFINVTSGHHLPIRKRAKFRWLSSRSSVASRWTWLTAQISDLEYRIRQQTDFYRQIRANKGLVTLQDPPPASQKPPVVPHADVKDVYTRVDPDGRRIVIKQPLPDPDPEDNNGCARTRPIRPVRKRQILTTKNFYKKSTRAAKESTVQCNCLHPFYWCAICYGRTNHVQVPDPISHESGKLVALLDHSYHQVLSSKNDVALDIQMSHKLKNRDWLSKSAATVRQSTKGFKKGADGSANHEGQKDRHEMKKKLKKSKEEGGDGIKRKKSLDSGLKKKKLLKSEKRRKSLTVHHHPDGSTATMLDLTTAGDQSELTTPQPQTPQANSALMLAEQMRRKRETAFDIDNIVIPYSMAASVRVEKIKYKEILTPTWRLIDDENVKMEIESKVTEDDDCFKQAGENFDFEDISDFTFEARHAKAEVEERKRWQMPLNKSSGRNRSRRQDSRAEASSGCNTPDPMSPGAVADLPEITTRPSTPVNEDGNASNSSLAASIRNRRRTSSATKSRDRNPSEDTQSSRCASPAMMEPLHEEILPYEPRKFPLSDVEFNVMLEDMPEGYDRSTPECAGLRIVDDVETGNRSSPVIPFSSRSSSLDEEEEETEDDPDWCAEDPDDPEWTGRKDASGGGGTPAAAASHGKRRASTASGYAR